MNLAEKFVRLPQLREPLLVLAFQDVRASQDLHPGSDDSIVALGLHGSGLSYFAPGLEKVKSLNWVLPSGVLKTVLFGFSRQSQ